MIVPVYWTNVKKTKPSTTHLLGINWYRNAHHHAQNAAKKDVSKLIEPQLDEHINIPGKYKVLYEYYYRTPSSDLMNVVALTSKIVNDALQEYGVVINDNVQYCIEEVAKVGGMDKDAPRCVVTITGVEDAT